MTILAKSKAEPEQRLNGFGEIGSETALSEICGCNEIVILQIRLYYFVDVTFSKKDGVINIVGAR
ncbi:hypothetical protein LBWT_1910 [Leptolyngbya boryana IAM M-101]|nr:hypothetical protein LBWT_1910 [Leptolyngbya boryana IAM M-101]BAS60653.1 hypothetical protein LBDG_01910 [Leptolyngbya boryana dg5]